MSVNAINTQTTQNSEVKNEAKAETKNENNSIFESDDAPFATKNSAYVSQELTESSKFMLVTGTYYAQEYADTGKKFGEVTNRFSDAVYDKISDFRTSLLVAGFETRKKITGFIKDLFD